MSDVIEKIDHGERGHSVWGGSAAYRFFNCAGSINAQKGKSNLTSVFAAEGTAAHELSESCLRLGTDAAPRIDDVLVVGNFTFTVTEEFADHVQTYLDAVRAEYRPELGDVLLIEEEFDLSDHVYPGTFGSADAVIWQPRNRRLVVIDLKFGAGYAVEIFGNPQLRYYGLGALLKGNYPAEEVEIIIVQPRAEHPEGPVRREVIPIMELLEFKSVLTDAILATLDPDAPRVAGPWCKFCLDEGTCATRRAQAVGSAAMDFSATPDEMDDVALGEIRLQAQQIKDWIKAVETELFNRHWTGGGDPRFKLIPKRATRKYADDDTVIGAAIVKKMGVDSRRLWAPPKLLSPAKLEAELGKSSKPDLAEFITAVSSGYKLVPATARGVAFVPQPGAAVDFGAASDGDD